MSDNPTTGLSFGQALEALHQGKGVARKGWNGKNMFLLYVRPQLVPIANLRGGNIQGLLRSRGLDHLHVQGHIDMWTADNRLCVGWLASQMDMQANDWEIVTLI